MITLRLVFAALCAMISTALGATALANAQAGPAWEVPARLVEVMTTIQPVALGLIALAAIIVGASYAIDRPDALPLTLLVAQLLVAVVVVAVATPDIAAQWPSTRPTLSEFARQGRLPVLALSALLGFGGAVLWHRSTGGGDL